MRATRNTCALAAAAIAVGLAASGCSSSSESAAATTTSAATTTTTTVATTATAAPAGTDLQTLLPTPPGTQQTKGPDQIADNGIHMHYQVTGSPNDVLNAYKSALEARGWQVTTIVTSAGGGGGGATYTGTHGDGYGVFDGGGYNTNTYIDVCTWPSKPANPNCTRSDR